MGSLVKLRIFGLSQILPSGLFSYFLILCPGKCVCNVRGSMKIKFRIQRCLRTVTKPGSPEIEFKPARGIETSNENNSSPESVLNGLV